ncbi:MAG TPA: cytochrome c peroxidase [Bryobacteraceae bacterium]|nr:cytochrome c peroxidase [Bryobacteraceae bacterium]
MSPKLTSLLLVVAGVQNSTGQTVPFGIPPELIQFVTPKDNPTTPERVALGRQLFNDKRLSADDTISCATCHDEQKGFSDGLPRSKGIKNQEVTRNSPTVLNAMFLDSMFLDGRTPTLEEQAKLPIQNPREMGMKDEKAVVAKLSAIPEYRESFQKVFGRAVNFDDMAKAIAAFERTVISGDAPIDRFLAGDAKALTESQRRGWTLYNGKGRCMTCHAVNPSYPFFTDNMFHNIGIAAHRTDFATLASKALRAVDSGNVEEIDRMALETEFSELGRFLVTKSRKDIGAFKTNTLRDIVLTAPYMHDGSLATLWDVMDHYNKGGVPNPFLDGGIQRLALTEEDINDLVALMDAFTSSQFKTKGTAEFKRQQAVAAGVRPERETDIAMGKKEHRGDPVPSSGDKDAALIGGRPVRVQTGSEKK